MKYVMDTVLTKRDKKNKNICLSGFRLEELEVFNWGTFHGKIWKTRPHRATSLLCGANGSGKSTLVDAFLTLLVPSAKRNYNVASGGDKKRERDEKSYMLGAYGKKRDEEHHISKIEYLRGKNDYSVLLAYFYNENLDKEVTLAQVFYFQNDVFRRLYVVAETRLTIQKDFSHFAHMKDLKKQLKQTPSVDVMEQFGEYNARFRKLMGIRSEKAMDLFNQTVAIKEIGNLNDFIRRHMLEKVDAMERMNTLRVNFNNLDKAHQAIVKAKHQLEHLNPLVKGLDQFEHIVKDIQRLDDVRAMVPAYFADRKLSLVREARQEGLLRLDQIHHQLRNLRQELDDLRKEEIRIMTAIDHDSHGQRMKELQERIGQLSIEAARKQKQTERYNALAEKLSLKTEPSEKQFYAAREKVNHLHQQAITQQEELVTQRDDLKIRLNEGAARIVHLEEELQSLLERKSQIPLKNLQLRDRLAKDLNIPESSLSFVGELLKVKDTAKDWEGAIERVFHNFGLRVLVPQEHYKRVNHYVNKTDLKGRLVYHKVGEEIFPGASLGGEGLLYEKVEIMPTTVFYDWIKHALQTRFDYVCCAKIEQLSKEVKAITQEGLIKREGALHEKDDRWSLHNRSTYILGWDNKEKISTLREQLVIHTKERDVLTRRVKAIETKQTDLQAESAALRDLFVFEDYQEINVKKPLADMVALKKNMQDLEKGSSVLRQLKKDLEDAQDSLQEKGAACRQKEKQETNLERDMEDFNRMEQECEGVLADVVIEEVKRIEQEMAEFLKETVVTIRNCDKVQQRVAASLFEQDKRRNQQRERLEKRVVLQMEKYKAAFPEEGLEVDSSIESVPDFRRMQTTIMKDDLPRYEKRFKELLDQKVIMDVSSFYNFLTKHVSIIKEKIQSLNHSLKAIDYSPATYIELNTEANRDIQIKEFQLMLRDCFEDVGITDRKKINEDSFFKIKKIIERFDTEEYWTRKVVDVRNWLNFSASERYREDNSEKNYYSDSSGKSGGQKAKLAYTILASAIAYQYGLNQTADMFAASADMSFRFVVIDEAFSKSDDANAQYAMELFQKLELQLLVVTPLEKTNVVEPYIAACHYVANTEKENDSSVYNLTIEEYHQKKKHQTKDQSS